MNLFEAALLLAIAAPASLAEPLGPSSRRTDWTISEILYHRAPRADGRQVEFIEIYNSGLIPEALGGHRLSGAVDYVIPPGTVVPARGFLVVAGVPADLEAVYGISGVVGGYTNRLADGGGTLRLHNPAGAVLLEVEYDDQPPWPAAADGAGHSLVLARPSFGERDPRAWAASVWMGGSPGQAEPEAPAAWAGLQISEVLAHTDDPALDFVELHNASDRELDLGGLILTDEPTTDRFRFTAGARLPPRGFLALDQHTLGFALNAAGETVFLLDPDHRRVLDALRFGPQANGVAFGLAPGAGAEPRPLSRPTPGSANAPARVSPVVINELMYHPISEDSDDEYVELYNQGTEPVDLGGWQFVAGIEFAFPSPTVLEPAGFLVVARHVTRLRTNHPGVSPSAIVGDYRGNLSNGGECIALARPEPLVTANPDGSTTTTMVWVVEDEVTWKDGGRWGRWADGGGSSLELIDPRADHRQAANWADSDETAKAPWTGVEVTGALDHGTGSLDSLQVFLQEAGACLLDNVEVRAATGPNLVANGGFDAGIGGWIAQGTQEASRFEPAEGAPDRGCLRVEAVARGDTGANRIRTPLAAGLSPGATGTIRARARWLYGHPELLLRLRGNYLEAPVRLAVPRNLGTPGAPNSRAVANAGPAMADLEHSPVLPSAAEPVRVSIRVHDPDGVGAVELRYRADPATQLTALPMRDDGVDGDWTAGDGVYTATLPGQASGWLVAFHVVATDAAAARATTRFPAQAPQREALIRWGESRPAGALATYRLWMTQAVHNRWSSRSKLDNAPLDVTFVYNGDRVVHGVGGTYAGSPHISPSYSTPSGNLCGYVLVFPPDEPFLGATDVVLDWPGRDTTAQQEPTAYWIARELGIPFNHRRFIRLHVNGVTETQRGSVYEDAQQVNSDLVSSWLPEGTDGDLFKIEQWFEFSDSVGTTHVGPPRLETYTTTGGQKKLARYRWCWLQRAVRGSANDYRSLFTLVDAANATDPESYIRQLDAFVDLEEWMRIFAVENIVVNLDAWGYDIGKNMYAYKPPEGRWRLFMWDIDWVMLASAQHGYSPTSPLMYRGATPFGEAHRDPVVGRMYLHPGIQRAYWRAIADALAGPLDPSRVAARLDAVHAALVANGVTRSSGGALAPPGAVKTWLRQRRAYLEGQLAQVNAAFQITGHGAAGFSTSSNLVTLTGTAPVAVKDIEVNGRRVEVRWTTITNWAARVVLEPGLNRLEFAGVDSGGARVPAATDTIDVTFDGLGEPPESAVVINEILHRPAVAEAAFVELHNRSGTTAFDLGGWRLDGVGFEFAPGALLPPRGYVVVTADRDALAEAFGIAPVASGEFGGTLREGGETLRLLGPDTQVGTRRQIDLVTFGTAAPWPDTPDGSSLQLLDPALDNRRVSSWAVAAASVPEPSRGLLAMTHRWRFHQSAPGPGLGWQTPGFDDSKWPEGAALFYVESSALPAAKNTPLTLGRTAYYFRTRFTSDADPRQIALALTTIVDDGAVFSLNGKEWFRLGMPAGTVDAGTFADRLVDNATQEGPFVLPATDLVQGENVLAVEVHQNNGSSTDIVFGAALETAPLAVPVAATPGTANSVSSDRPPVPDLWINELLPWNRDGAVDRFGEHEPWLELYNAGTTPVTLDGFHLTDSWTALHRSSFPPGVVIDPGAFLLVWLDGETTEATPDEIHAGFRPAPDAGFVALTQVLGNDTVIVDYLEYTVREPDRSVGFHPDGQGDARQPLPLATPAAANRLDPAPLSVWINEWMAANQRAVADPADGDYDDWFELFNAGSTPADLAGYTLTDDAADPRKFVIAAGTVIPARGFLLVWADEEASQAEGSEHLHVNFRLAQSGESIALYTPDGRLVDSVRFGAQAVDRSEGRWPDGGPGMGVLSRPTPRAANAPPPGVEDTLEILAVERAPEGSIRITWASTVGAVYRVQATAGLEGPDAIAWENASDELAAITGTTTYVDSTALPLPRRFYRVQRVR